MIISGPFAMEVNLEIGGIELVHSMSLDATGHSEELLVIDHMKLWCEVVGVQIADEANQGGMVAGKAKKLAKVSARAPLRNFVAVLEFWIQDVSRASKNLCMAQVLTVEASATKELHGGKAAIMPWHM